MSFLKAKFRLRRLVRRKPLKYKIYIVEKVSTFLFLVFFYNLFQFILKKKKFKKMWKKTMFKRVRFNKVFAKFLLTKYKNVNWAFSDFYFYKAALLTNISLLYWAYLKRFTVSKKIKLVLRYTKRLSNRKFFKTYTIKKTIFNYYNKFKQNFFWMQAVNSISAVNKHYLNYLKISNAHVNNFFFKILSKNFLSQYKLFFSKQKGSISLFSQIIFRRIDKSHKFIIRVPNYRWALTHINFVFNYSRGFYSILFMFSGIKYFRNLKFFKPYYQEYWLLYNLFQNNNNRRWINFFKKFTPSHIRRKFSRLFFKKVKRFGSLQFMWLDKKYKKKILKYYYLTKYALVRSLYFFYLKTFMLSNFAVNFNFLLRRSKFDKHIKKFFWRIYFNFFSFQRKFKRPFYLYEFIELAFLSMKTKNIDIFGNWVVNKMGYIYFRNHWKFIYFLNLFFKKYFIFFQRYFGVKGIQYKFKGKINAKGSVRKKSLRFNLGVNSYCNVALKSKFFKSVVRTDTGVISFFCLLSF